MTLATVDPAFQDAVQDVIAVSDSGYRMKPSVPSTSLLKALENHYTAISDTYLLAGKEFEAELFVEIAEELRTLKANS